MKIAIHQPQYMPWLGYFHKMASVDLFVLLDDVQFKKNEWQHRNRIRNPQGTQWLSVPNSYRFPQFINEVAVRSDQDWQRKHLQSIKMCYGKAKFFAEYSKKVEAFFDQHYDTIADVTIATVRLLANLLGIETRIEISSSVGFEGTSTERLVNICGHYGGEYYLAGAGGHDYMDLTCFEQAGIAVGFQEFTCPMYHQHWCKSDEDFIPNLSALDLLFNVGPHSLSLLMGKEPQ